MTKEQQRIAIAEACGYERLTQHEAVWRYKGSKIYTLGNLPDYLNDLNAMHEAEKVLNELSWMHYLRNLAEIVRKPKQCEIRISQYVQATATQRAEAFLRTIGKWEEAQ